MTDDQSLGLGGPGGEEMPAHAYNRRAEVEEILRADQTLLGRVYHYDLQGLNPAQIAEAEGNATVGFVDSYRTQIKALLDGDVPSSPNIALQSARRIRKWLRTESLSDELHTDLLALESLLMSRAGDATAQIEEIQTAVRATESAEASGTPGIYVYTLPHYLRHPFDPETGRTLLKVGHSSTDAYYRAGSQGRLTALPEDPILLRIYPVAESATAERDFHGWLKDADHSGARTRRGGSEWFVTSTKFLDRIARSKGLDVIAVTEFEAGDE